MRKCPTDWHSVGSITARLMPELLGIRPDYVIELAPQLLAAHDGPTLEQGLKSFHLKPLPQRPTRRADWPKPDYLEQRYHGFLSAQQRLR